MGKVDLSGYDDDTLALARAMIADRKEEQRIVGERNDAVLNRGEPLPEGYRVCHDRGRKLADAFWVTDDAHEIGLYGIDW
jgi:hypothetical protein